MKISRLFALVVMGLVVVCLMIVRPVQAVAPTISDITDKTTGEDTPIGPIDFTVGDSDTDPALLAVTATSNNQTVVPDGNIVLGGAGADRTITLTPAANQIGTATITVEVSDGVDFATDTFLLTVTNTAPTITAVADQTISQDSSTGALPFTIGDGETSAGSLIVTAASSNTTLVPNAPANIALGGMDASRTITVTPVTGQNGLTTITISVSDGIVTTTEVFTVTVTAPNTPPTITAVADQAINEDGATGELAFTIGDGETNPGSLTVTAVSSNTSLVPNAPANIALGGIDASRTIIITPAANQSGVTTITISVSDGTATTTEDFIVTVTALNDPPTVTTIADVTINVDTSTGAIPFTIGDIDNPITDLVVTAVADNTTLVPGGAIVLGGTAESRTITITPAAGLTGSATITVSVVDLDTLNPTLETFLLTVNYVNQPPVVSNIPNQTTAEDVPTAAIPFTIGDDLTLPSALTVTAVSTNTVLLPNGNITLGGSDTARTIILAPAANLSGVATVKVNVSDGEKSTERAFDLTVLPVNDAPTLDLNGSQSGVNHSVAFYTNGNAVALAAPGMLLSDIDSLTLASATVTIANPLDAAAELLTANTSGTAITAVFNSGTLTLSGVDTLANYAQVLRSVTYRNTAAFPDLSDRIIDFTVNDGVDSSAVASVTVALFDPGIEIIVTPSTQTVGSGGTAVFSVQVTNVGNAPLTGVNVSVPLHAGCETGWTWSNLAAGESHSYSCALTQVTNEITLTFEVTSRDANSRNVTASAVSRVEVENPNIQIVKGPLSQTVRKGETAQFTVFLFNPSATVNLVEVEIEDPIVPDCSRSGDCAYDNLNREQEVVYTCALENVTAAFTNVITATGKNQLTDEIVSDSSVAFVELLDLTADLSVAPTTVTDSGGPLTYTLTVSNTGTVNVNLTGLSTNRFGSLTNPDNSQLVSNTCAINPLPTLAKGGGAFACTFVAEPAVAPPSFSVTVQVNGQDEGDTLPISTEATAIVEVQATPTLNLSLSADPSVVDAPGGNVRFYVSLSNDSQSGSMTVDTLVDSRLGNLGGVGSCDSPITLAMGDTYNCSYQTRVNGTIGSQVTHTVTASGTASNDQPVTSQAQATVTIKNPGISTILLPMIAANFPPVENNDLPCDAYGIATNHTYSFLPDDQNDWYYFDLSATRDVTVRINNLVVTDSQVAVWSGPCNNVSTLVGFNGDSRPNMSITMNDLTPGRYFVWVVNDDNKAYATPYTLRVNVP